MPRNLELENGRIICTPQSTLVANEKATTLSLSSSTEEIKRYFKAILELSKLDFPIPLTLIVAGCCAILQKKKQCEL